MDHSDFKMNGPECTTLFKINGPEWITLILTRGGHSDFNMKGPEWKWTTVILI